MTFSVQVVERRLTVYRHPLLSDTVEKNLHSKIFQMLSVMHLLLILFGEQQVTMVHLLNRLAAVWMTSLLTLLTTKE